MKARVFWFTMLVVAFSVLWLPSANAYVDPGSGSFLFQALIGGLLAAGVAIKVFWKRLAAIVTRRSPEQAHDD
ncbi:MAG TPA: hypothetical protein VIB62_06225 [Actinomycetota bacterium]|jgi:hypothetical protein